MDIFPVTESTLSASQLGQYLRNVYGLGPNTSSKLFRTGINHLYLVTDEKAKFVFRVYTFNWRTVTDVSEEIRLLLHLKENKVPVSYPIADQKGMFIQYLNAPEGLRYGVLFSFAEGNKMAKFTPEISYQIGIAMAKMHKVTENFDLKRINYNATTLIADSLIRTKSFFTNPSEEMTFIEKATDYLIKEYDKIDTKTVRDGIIHLDIWFDNMHFNGNEVTIFDFDFCGTGWQCHDIGYFMYQLYWTHPDENEYKPKYESFINGYESITKIPDEEKRIIPIVSLAILLFFISIQCERYDTWSNVFLNEDHLKRYTGSIKKWMAYHKISME